MTPIQIYRYQLPLDPPLQLARGQLTKRDGVLLRQLDRSGNNSWAEAAPLPGFSQETVDEVIAAAKELDWQRYPSLWFARQTLDDPRVPPPSATIPLNALLLGSPEEVTDQAHRLSVLDIPSVKLKVGIGMNVAEAIRLTRVVRHRLGTAPRMRLDANQAWNLPEAMAFAEGVADLDLEYVEEPTANPNDFETIFQATGLRYALDETLQRTGFVDLDRFPHVAACVIKPTLVTLSSNQLSWAQQRKIPIVYSASFESGLGLQLIARRAYHDAPGVPAGLDTYRWLADDVLTSRLDLASGRMPITNELQVDVSKLKLVAEVVGP